MKYQIPLDLIDQIQINLNNESNLSSFNQLNSSIPPLPTIEQAISSIDLSSDNLKCNNCNGSFLRGFESLICIYCGQNNQQKSIPQSIPFKSTIGFRLLLDSLGLDPSQESVGSPSDHVQSNKEQTSLEDEISLADLLSLDLKWPDEFNRNDVKKVEIYPKKGFLNLVGEDFAEGSSREHVSRISTEQQVTIERTGNNESAKFGEQNTESYAAVLRSADGEQGESSAWEAEFQSANQSTAYDNLQSSNVSILPSVEGGIDGDSMSLAPPESNLTDANHSSNSGPVNSSSKLAGSTEDLEKNSSVDPPNDEKIVDDNAIDEWGEFSAGAGPENNHSKPSSSDISGGLDFSDAWNDFSGSVAVEPRQLHTEINKMPNDESLSLWNNLASESKADDIHLDSGSINLNQHVVHHDGSTDPMLQWNDFAFSQQQDQLISQTDEIGLQSTQISSGILDDPLHVRGIKSPTHIVAEAGDSFDFWNDFKSSTVERHETSNVREDDKIHYGAGDSKIDAWSDIASSIASKEVLGLSSAEVVASDRNGTHDDSLFSTSDNLGAWNNFTGSTVTDDKPIGVDHSSGPWNDLSYLTETHADLHQGSGTQAGAGHTTFENDGLIDSWSDFRTSNTQVGNSILLPNMTESTHDQVSVKTAHESQRVTADNDKTLDFGPSTLASKTPSQTAGAEFSEKNSTDVDNDFFNGWSYSGNNNGVAVNKGTSSGANSDAFDSWSEFASPINIQDNSSVSKPAIASDPGEAVKLDDPFDTWKTFSSSSGVQTHGDTAVVNESDSESNLFETGPNLQGTDSSSFIQVDQLFGTVGDKKCSAQTDASLAPEVPDMLRMENGDVKADNIPAEVMNQSKSTTKPSHPSSSDVETLISEMHDLSFMLETTLTVPSRES